MRTPTRIGIVLDSMWTIKDYMLSGALDVLSESFDIVVLCSPGFLDDSKKLAESIGLNIKMQPLKNFEPSFLFQASCKLQKSLLYERYDIDTERMVQSRTSSGSLRARSSFQNVMSRIMRLIAKSPIANAMDALIDTTRKKLTPTGLYSTYIDNLGLDILFITDPIERKLDPLFYECIKRGIPVAALVVSWDNLTTKGRIHNELSKIMVWNEVMEAEVKRMYPSYSPSQIKIVGFPRFDVYGRVLSESFKRDWFLSGLGLDPNGRVILLASSNVTFFKNQTQVFRHVCEAQQQGVFPKDVQILIRCHPHDPIGEYSELRRFPKVAIWPELTRCENGTLFNQIPHKDDLNILAATIKHSAVCVVSGSTVMLDAALCDIPIVCVAYDGDRSLPHCDSIASAYVFSHQKPFHEIGATEICYSKDSLIAAIKAALENPEKKSLQRKLLVKRFLGDVGVSAHKIRNVLFELAHDS